MLERLDLAREAEAGRIDVAEQPERQRRVALEQRFDPADRGFLADQLDQFQDGRLGRRHRAGAALDAFVPVALEQDRAVLLRVGELSAVTDAARDAASRQPLRQLRERPQSGVARTFEPHVGGGGEFGGNRRRVLVEPHADDQSARPAFGHGGCMGRVQRDHRACGDLGQEFIEDRLGVRHDAESVGAQSGGLRRRELPEGLHRTVQ